MWIKFQALFSKRRSRELNSHCLALMAGMLRETFGRIDPKLTFDSSALHLNLYNQEGITNETDKNLRNFRIDDEPGAC